MPLFMPLVPCMCAPLPSLSLFPAMQTMRQETVCVPVQPYTRREEVVEERREGAVCGQEYFSKTEDRFVWLFFDVCGGGIVQGRDA
jgi:hypothetical protein